MRVTMRRANDSVLFCADNDIGNSIFIDGSSKVGGVDGGFRPMQLLLAGIGGCSAIDVVSILKKQRQNIEDVEIVVDGQREEDATPSVFKEIHLHYVLYGELDTAKVERALELGIEKYCSVGEMLKKTATVTYDYEIKRKDSQ
jgi:putative redox protein